MKKKFNDEKKPYLYDRFFVSNQILQMKMLKLLKIPGFSRLF